MRPQQINLVNKFLQARGSVFVQNVALYGSSASIAQAIMMLYALLLARVLGPDRYGTFAGTYAVAGLSSFFLNWGMDTWLLREGANSQTLIPLSSTILRIKSGFGIVWGAALVVIFPLLRGDIFSHSLMLVCVFDVWADSCFNTQIATLNVDHRLKLVSRLLLLSRGGRFLGALFVIGMRWASPVTFAISRCTFTVIGLIAVSMVLRPNPFRASPISERNIFRRSLPYGVSEFLAIIYAQADVFMVTLLGNKYMTGIYSAAEGVVNALFVIPNAGYFVSIPILSRLAHKDSAQLVSKFEKMMKVFLILGLLMGLMVSLPVSSLIRFLLGPSYRVTGIVIMLLSPILLLKCLEYGWASFLLAVNWQQYRIIPQVVSALANVMINFYVIPRYGVYGVAIVYVFSEMILAAGYGWLVWKWIHHRPMMDEYETQGKNSYT